MIKLIAQSSLFLLSMTLLTGVIYPLLVTGLSHLLWPQERLGSLIKEKNSIVGSALIAQKFTGLEYFWSRPSACDYNALLASGSNLGPTSLALKEIIAKRRLNLARLHHSAEQAVPESLITASASGIDPHIPTKAATFQIERIAKARKLDEASRQRLHSMVDQFRRGTQMALFKEPEVNVLLLNLALDKAFGKIPK